MEKSSDAMKAREALNGKIFDGRKIEVNNATPRLKPKYIGSRRRGEQNNHMGNRGYQQPNQLNYYNSGYQQQDYRQAMAAPSHNYNYGNSYRQYPQQLNAQNQTGQANGVYRHPVAYPGQYRYQPY